MEHEAHFSWFHGVPGLGGLEEHVASTAVVCGLLVLFTLAARLSLARHRDYLVPADRLTFLNFADIVSENLYGMTKSILGHDAPKYFPIMGGLFLYILTSNLIGMIPG